jgi:hypothetical protein
LVDRENISDVGSAYGGLSQGSASKSRHSGIAAGIGQLAPAVDKIIVNDQRESSITRTTPKPFDQYLTQGIPNPSKTMMQNAGNNNYINSNDVNDHFSGAEANRNRMNAAKTIDPEEDKASNYDTVSAGGTRYIVGLKGNLKFYGQ